MELALVVVAFITIAFFAGRWMGTKGHQQATDRALGDILVPIRGLSFGKLISPSACAGCGHAMYELRGHPFWNTSCSNEHCGANHVARGNRDPRASVKAEPPPAP